MTLPEMGASSGPTGTSPPRPAPARPAERV
ncbi:hypothetical protein ACFUN7_34765 [Streptomyces sp. NPDC057236]